MSTWVYIAHKGDYWGGLIAANIDRKSLSKFMSDYVKDGFDIMAVPDREKYLKIIDTMKPWNESPDYVPTKRARKR